MPSEHPSQDIDNGWAPYSRVAMLLHWLVAMLVLFEFLTAASFRFFNPGQRGYFHSAYPMHMSAGMSLLALSVCWIAWRLSNSSPPLPRDMGRVMRGVAKVAHLSLYGFMFAVPFLGWVILSARDSAALLLGTFHWPEISLLGDLSYLERLRINDALLPVHAALAYTGLALIALHAAAAFYHHFWQGDRVLERMLPSCVHSHHIKQRESP